MSYVTIGQIFIPEDIISVIFCMLKDSDRYYAWSRSKFDSSLRWVPEVTHVSHSWREIALSNNTLWTDINVGASIAWAVEFARRSGQASIRISLNLPANIVLQIGPKFTKCTKTLLHENRQRIREINLNNVDAEDILSAAVSEDNELQPFPILESLTTAFNSRQRSSFLLTNRNIFAPKLKSLSLEGCSIGEDFGSFRNLSRLSVINDGPLMTTAMFLRSALSEMSNLESLKHTINAASMSTSPVDFGNQVLALPKLHKLDINGWPIESTISILQAISHGPLRNVSVDGCPTDRLDQVLHLFNCISPHAMENQNVDQLHLVIRAGWNKLRISCKMGRHFTGGADLLNTVSSSQGNNSSRGVLEGLLRMINYQDLEHLELHLSYTLPAWLWVEHFGQLQLLTSIGISWGVQELFTALMNGLSEDVQNGTTMMPSFPALNELKIEMERQLYSKEEIELMLQCLRRRLDLGIGLKKLSFSVEEPDDLNLDYDYDWADLQDDLRAQLSIFTDVVESMVIVWV